MVKDIEYFQEDDYTEFLENGTYKDVVEGYVDSGFWEWNEDKSAILFDKNKSYENWNKLLTLNSNSFVLMDTLILGNTVSYSIISYKR